MERKIDLDNRFIKNMPCINCELNFICKYSHSIKRPDFNEQVFDISVTCKIKDESLNKLKWQGKVEVNPFE